MASHWLREYKPDAVLVTTGRDIRSVGLAARRRGIPVIWRMGPKPKNNLIHRLTGALISHVIAPSETVKNELQRFAWLRRKITVINNGIAIFPRPSAEQVQAARAMLGMPNDKFLCLYVGRLMTGKGIDTLIEAFAKVSREIPFATLWIVGSGPSDGLAREKVAQLGLTSVVSFAGFSDDPSVYFAACDLFVLPSRYESFSYVLLEAMLHAKPCITTRAGAIPEVVGEDAAVLVSPGSADMLADAIMKLIGDPTRRMELAAKGRERVIDRFDLNKTVDAVEMLFRTKVKTA
jgi:glycosyltransferase involved in cell wall biosynthesis